MEPKTNNDQLNYDPADLPSRVPILDEIKKKIAELTADERSKFSALDGLDDSGMDHDDAIEVAGVYFGLKQVCYIYQTTDSESPEDGEKTIMSVIDGLGMHFEFTTEENDQETKDYYGHDYVHRMIVSKDPDKITEFKGLSDMALNYLGMGLNTDEIEYEIGELLGYPRTATEAFLGHRARADRNEINATGQRFGQITFSKDLADEEIEQYAKPLEVITHELLPKIYRQRL
ncbi:MAG: hypothetical protein LBK50_00365 [Candidatus Nomurabacteria bacterium]|jgi:hypothetical protein|nr:hypothetical protein [Candidatus Nomurabacteria bacterium]